MEEEKTERTLGERMRFIEQRLEEDEEKKKPRKSKNFKIPAKGRVRKTQVAKGMATIIQINENNAVTFTKEEIVGSTIKLDDTFHSVQSEDVLTWKGLPLLIIPKIKKNPYNPNKKDDGKNETFGQKHIMSRMLNEAILGAKKKFGVGMSIGALVILAVIVYALFAG